MVPPRVVVGEVAFCRRGRPPVVYAVGDVLLHPTFVDDSYDYEIGAPVFLQFADGYLTGRDD